ncbi:MULTISPECIES: hypothetical protein [unclassified Yoonia]|uniref:hypothetical protein n=1 Tax=unclassified Yoonia TaxID=2629118 RepID=UPI002AFEA90E|nr:MULTISPECIES: hypothetical protein [unclassified Yoonia]
MNMNRLISMIVRQVLNVAMRKGMQMASKTGQKPRTAAPTDTNIKQAAKVTRRVIR